MQGRPTESFPLYMMKNIPGATTFGGSTSNSPRRAGNRQIIALAGRRAGPSGQDS